MIAVLINVIRYSLVNVQMMIQRNLLYPFICVGGSNSFLVNFLAHVWQPTKRHVPYDGYFYICNCFRFVAVFLIRIHLSLTLKFKK